MKLLLSAACWALALYTGFQWGAAVFPYYAQECIQLEHTATAQELYRCMLRKKHE